MEDYTVFEEVIGKIQQSILDSWCLVCDRTDCLERKSFKYNRFELLLLFIKRKAMEAKDMHYSFNEFFDICKSEFNDMVSMKFTNPQAFDDMKKMNLRKDEFLSILMQIEGVILQAEMELINESPKADETPQRVIDVEQLKDYFIASFKGIGNGNINFFDMMIEELKMERSSKDFARIALMIYNSKKMNHNRLSTFAKWYKIFCNCVGCEKKSYKPEHLTPTDSLIKVFGYL